MAINEFKLEKWVYGTMAMMAKGSRKEIIDKIAESIEQYDDGGCAFSIFRDNRALNLEEKIDIIDAARERKSEIIEELDKEIDHYIEALREKEPDLTGKLVTVLNARMEFND